jgi:phosphate transport system permease protein
MSKHQQEVDSQVMGGHDFAPRLRHRHRMGNIWRMIFRVSTVVGILALGLLLANIVNDAFGYVAVVNTVDPLELGGGHELESLPKESLVQILEANVSSGLFRRFAHDEPFEERSSEDVINLIYEHVVKPRVVNQWTLFESLTRRRTILAQGPVDYPGATLRFESWVDKAFVTSPQSADATRAGIRTAILGSLWTIAIAIVFAFPIGVGAAIYLEEYAEDTALNRLIQTNINNLAGVPSIIYGILGLSIFVRALQPLTSGAAFGLTDPTTANGRTIISAGMTLGLLILPLIIINAQEAIKAVPNSLREAALGLGATRWQTVWGHVLPNAMSGILTGAILAVSRAIGETAPLVVVGASTYITADPSGPFAKFTTLPIQIFQWTTRPQSVFRNIAAAAIIVLLAMLLSMNGAAILLRNRFSKRL